MLKNEKIFVADCSVDTAEKYSKKLEKVIVQSYQVNKEDFEISFEKGTIMGTIWGKAYPIRETALNSMLCRYNIFGDTMRKIPDDVLCSILSLLHDYLPNVVNVMIADGAINSINSEKYSHIPQKDVFERTTQVLMPLYSDGNVVCSVDADYAVSTAYFRTDRNYKFNGYKRCLTIKLTNSENGESSLSYQAFLQGKGRLLPIMSEIRIVHKGEADIDKVDTALSELEAVVTQNVEAVKLLEDINVTAPITAVKELMAEAGLPRKQAIKLAEKMEASRVKTYSAATLYEMVYEQIKECGKEERYTNDVLKLTRANWNKYCSNNA